MPHFRKSASTRTHRFKGHHRFEHWYRDNTVYFITARCRERRPAFVVDDAKAIFWDRFDHYTRTHGFTPFVTTLIDNHYHTLGYLRQGENLGPMMRKLHGSVAKLANDVLEQLNHPRLTPFWREAGHQNYFDGCIRDEKQCRLAYTYTCIQSVRHGICKDWRTYPHTRLNVAIDAAVARAHELDAFLENVPYARYQKSRRKG
ncbi:MAG: hypothetical protein WD534_07390 [Phycisphaeraceae bacterium]